MDWAFIVQIISDICTIIGQGVYLLATGIVESLYHFFFPYYKSLSDDVILVTGGGGGIGRLMLIDFAKYCPNLIAWDVNKAGLDETAEMVKSQTGCTVRTYVVDLRSRDDVFEAAKKVMNDVGRRVTVLVNNAGIVSAKPLLQLKPTEIENTFKVNILSHFYTIQAFLPYMIGEKSLPGAQPETPRGHIVSVASVAGEIPALGLSDYCATKAAALSLMDTLELELYEMKLGDRIHLTSIMPFFMDTKLFAGCKPEFQWLFPIVPATVCANRIVEAVRKNDRAVFVTGRYAVLPLMKRFLPPRTVRGLYTLVGAEKFSSQLLEEREASAKREAAAESKTK
ncbi:unnamed protein product [Calicophoron daubneyi]|uniref:Short-chain dehydrogenase/reductase 3 n=1 Tax=Calicophoron daubneyi TaxID=300641 RepID=A0AAV2TJQ3_CALDB